MDGTIDGWRDRWVARLMDSVIDGWRDLRPMSCHFGVNPGKIEVW